MKSRPIIQIDNSSTNPLRQQSREIQKEEFGTPWLHELITHMKTSLAKEKDGVAIAAPQIGENVRIFVVSPNAYEEETKYTPLVFINPVIVKQSKKSALMHEGCLSVRWIYGKTKRKIASTVEAYDEYGKKFVYGGSGLLSHIFQHEIDHLDGILFIDHGFDLEEYTEEEVKASAKKDKDIK